MNRIAILIVTLFCASALAQDLPKIAVYVTSKMFEHENKVLEKKMTAALVRIGQYRVVDRSAESSDKLAAEHIKQRDGSVDEKQIKMLGKQYGVDFICIADITSAFGGFQVSASIINVETAVVVSMGETSSKSMTLGDLSRSLDEVLERMFNNQIMAAPKPEAAAAPGQILMKPKYENTKMYQSEHLGAYGSPSIIGPNDVLTVLYAEKNYYKVRTASGKEGFVMRKDVINNNTLFVDIRPGHSAVNKRADANPAREEKVRTASGKEVLVMQKDVINNNAQIVDIRPEPSNVNLARGEAVLYDFTVGQRFGTWGVNYFIAGLGSLTIMKDYTGAAIHAGSAVGGFGMMIGGVANQSPELFVTGALLVTGGSVFSVVRSITYHKPNSEPWPSDFTTGERWGTFGLNYLIPGLGSLVIMKDYTGAVVQASSAVVGISLYTIASLNVINDLSSTGNSINFEKIGNDLTLMYTGAVVMMFSNIWNIARSASYNHTNYKKTAVNPIEGLNFAVLPDQDGNIKGYVAYRMEF
jgi:hypothetical protein